MGRIILHLDLDSFYAAVEELRRPEIRGKPVVVCMYSGRENSGAVATANYQARALGIRAGLPLRTARARATPETVFLPADREHYAQVSDRIMGLLRKYADRFEQRSIDEAYLDVSSAGSCKKAEAIARAIKKEVLKQEQLTCSIGIGPNKLIAKMASREKKPDGLTIVQPSGVGAFLSGKPVEQLFGVGPRTLEGLKKFRVRTISDLARLDAEKLKKEFGERKGQILHEHALGRDEEPVQELVKQQASRIGTLAEDTRDREQVLEKLNDLAGDLHKKLREQRFRTITLIAITRAMEMKTRSVTLEAPSNKKEDILSSIRRLLKQFLQENKGDVLRRVGVRVSLEQPEEKRQKALSEFS